MAKRAATSKHFFAAAPRGDDRERRWAAGEAGDRRCGGYSTMLSIRAKTILPPALGRTLITSALTRLPM